MSLSPADRTRPAPSRAAPRLLPARPVIGFTALLAVLFALSYAVGAAAGPVAPGMHPAGGARTGSPGSVGDGGGMGGMHGAGGRR
ncbi:hypothetical protein [Streptomyces sp. NPDC048650]|uniref:hypothetical protein n=1 Tax=unclassified Streptomyces TaxID=2593676 RepID=UPI0037182BFC